MDEIMAVLLAVNMLLITVVMAFCWKINRDWSQLIAKLNTDWSAIYMLMMNAYDDMNGEHDNE